MKYKLLLIFTVSFLAGCASTSHEPNKNPVSSMATSAVCQEGTTRRGFTSMTTMGDVPCSEGVQTCLSGIWQGPHLYQSCESMSKSCGGAMHGTVVIGYLQPSASPGFSCTSATKTCLNGSWIGPEVYTTCTEQ